jgi:hypothetical protein
MVQKASTNKKGIISCTEEKDKNIRERTECKTEEDTGSQSRNYEKQ